LVRRAAEIALVSADDYETRNAKTNLYTEVNGKWQMDTNIKHRQMSNNTILYKKKPAREALHEHVQTMRISGEPKVKTGFYKSFELLETLTA
jgi:ribonucleoside-diphosphate reductase alpha chain/ribonucleoside-triphosphate reductase